MEAIWTIGQKHKSFRVMQKLIIYKIMHSFYSILNIQSNVYVTHLSKKCLLVSSIKTDLNSRNCSKYMSLDEANSWCFFISTGLSSQSGWKTIGKQACESYTCHLGESKTQDCCCNMKDIVIYQAEDFAETTVSMNPCELNVAEYTLRQRPIATAFAVYTATVWQRQSGRIISQTSCRVNSILNSPIGHEPIAPTLSATALKRPLQAVQCICVALIFSIVQHSFLKPTMETFGNILPVKEPRETRQ